MVNAQQWLDKKYPKETDSISPEIDILLEKLEDPMSFLLEFQNAKSVNDNKDKFVLEGNLTLKSFPNLTNLDLSGGHKITELNFSDCNNLKILNCSNNLLNELNVLGLNKLEKLNCSKNKISELRLLWNETITELDCSNNELKSISLPLYPVVVDMKEKGGRVAMYAMQMSEYLKKSMVNHLEKFDCSNNLLENCSFLCNLESAYFLEHLDISNNNFSPTDIGEIKAFNYLMSLRILNIGSNDADKLSKEIHNRFYGSLKVLKNLPRLKGLGISYTNIDSGLEYLSEKVEIIESFCQGSNSKVIKIFQELEPFEMNYRKWKENWEQNKSPEKILKQEREKTENLRKLNNQLSNSLKQKTEEAKSENDKWKEQIKKVEEKNNQLLEQNKEKDQQVNESQKIIDYQQSQIERQARQIVSLRSKYLTSQILNKQKEILEKQNKSSNKIFTKEELNSFLQIHQEIDNLKQQISNLRLEKYQARIEVAPK